MSTELGAIVRQAPRWKFPLADGNVLVLDEKATERRTWTGSRHFKGWDRAAPGPLQFRQKSFSALGRREGGRSDSVDGSGLGVGMGVEELDVSDRLEYYVVVMVWRARTVDEDGKEEEEREENGDGDAAGTTAPAVGQVRRGMRRGGYAIPTFYG